MPKEYKKPGDLARDKASIAMLKKAENEKVSLSFFRVDDQKNPCGFGTAGLCCRICHMGPCRITKKSLFGVCGADAATIVARNFLREAASGAAAHSDHSRHLVLLLKKISQDKAGFYKIQDERALVSAAKKYGIETEGREYRGIAGSLADVLLKEFASQEEPLVTPGFAPQKRRGVWERADVLPLGIDRTVVEALHRTHMGVDHDYKSILTHAFRTSLADGWAGSRIASAVSDIIFGTPSPVRSQANLGVLGMKTVNVLVHGHEPDLSEMIAAASSDPEIKEYAKKAGADGITVAGICCTANEILMRHGIPIAGNFLQQELALVTGAVEMMVVDVQCCMPSLPEVASAYHTKIISTSDIAATLGAERVHITADTAFETAKNLLKTAIDNYANRDPEKVNIPDVSKPLVAGFSVDAIRHMLGGTFRAGWRPLNDAVMQGRIRGVAGIVGCCNPRQKLDEYTISLTKELIKNDILVLKTGCAAIASAKEGLLMPEAALEFAGTGLREVCEAVGMPPVLHMGSCVDNSRILEAAAEIVFEGGLGDDIADLPVVGFAPEWMSEKAVTIGCYFVASGIDVILGRPFFISGSDDVMRFLGSDAAEIFGASFHVHDNPLDAAEKAIQIINARRAKLGIDRHLERKLMDMKDRRELNV